MKNADVFSGILARAEAQQGPHRNLEEAWLSIITLHPLPLPASCTFTRGHIARSAEPCSEDNTSLFCSIFVEAIFANMLAHERAFLRNPAAFTLPQGKTKAGSKHVAI